MEGTACFKPRQNCNQTGMALPIEDYPPRSGHCSVIAGPVYRGTDIPTLTARYVEEALNALAEFDLVLGPVDDGGYCLIAMREPHPAVFDRIPWSTPRVLSETLDAARRLSLTVALREPLWDVDDAHDLQRWRAWQRRSCGAAP